MKTDETYRKTEVLFCIDTKRVCTGDDSQCSVARMLRQRHEKKRRRKKNDRLRLRVDNDAMPEGYPVGIMTRMPKEPGRSNLRHPVTTPIRPSLSRPFPRATMCFSSVLMVGELVVVNNIVTIAATSVKIQLFAECLYEPGAVVWIAPREKT
ncbi:hypothetical protein ALC53_14007 [Atta colombica]|uniref:Uncharacterized protein n=1 Tax=Atta colombica TaxID=520822 RepID=A0A195AUB9_9HYME|nr:hypothetical protein ALC53_14007 [Atta colombica]